PAIDVREHHHNHSGRIWPYETAEGPKIGLIGSLASYAKVNEFGFVETPFRRVYNRLAVTKENKDRLQGRILRRPAVDEKGKEVLAAGKTLDAAAVTALEKAKVASIDIQPFVSVEVEYLSADEE